MKSQLTTSAPDNYAVISLGNITLQWLSLTNKSLRDVDLQPHPVPDLEAAVCPLHGATDGLHPGLDGELTASWPLLHSGGQAGAAAGQSAHTGGPHPSPYQAPAPRPPCVLTRPRSRPRPRILRDLQTPDCSCVRHPGTGVNGSDRLCARN